MTEVLVAAEATQVAMVQAGQEYNLHKVDGLEHMDMETMVQLALITLVVVEVVLIVQEVAHLVALVKTCLLILEQLMVMTESFLLVEAEVMSVLML
jgi:hypothetical protein